MKKTTIGAILFLIGLLATPAVDAAAGCRTLNVNANCSNAKMLGWMPADAFNGEQVTIQATWKKKTVRVIAALVCGDDVEAMPFGAVGSDLRGSLLLQTGVIGEVCVVGFCTAGGSTKIQVNILTGDEEASVIGMSSRQLDGSGLVGEVLQSLERSVARAER